MPVVVVESPAKAKTINAYLGANYTVLPSYGHVRDLPPKDGSVLPDSDFEMVWQVDPSSKKHMKAIADAVKADGELILATDPDREGEAISWHLLEALQKSRALKKDSKVSRVTFNAITKSAVTQAMQAPREIDAPLVEAYLARRALDYLVGFNLSPVLWRKLPGAKSAGRVQSVALRLVVEREMEIEAFDPQEYWTVKAELQTPRGERFEARLSLLDGRKIDRLALPDQAAAQTALDKVAGADLKIASVEARPTSRNPSAPFMTSTLQQEASRKLGFGPKQTMSLAQRLYEAGRITYMRTDGVDMAPEAVSAAREAIKSRYGARYIPEKPRIWKSKAKNAQEAHECVRPTDMGLSPDRMKAEPDQQRLYELIWKRAIASQMESARLERTTIDITGKDVGLRATGQVVKFDGFLAVYEEGRDDAGDEDGGILPEVKEGEAALLPPFADSALKAESEKREGAHLAAERAVLALQSHTSPPPRYTEASLVKKMEELGIGRPSTYASIIDVIGARGYVEKDKGRLVPEDKGRLVTIFLENYFGRYVEYSFTAQLEELLDDVSGGRADWKEVLRDFWRDFSGAVGETKELRISEVLERIDEVLAPHLFPPKADGSDPRRCEACGDGRLSLKTGKFGAFIGCSNYPECRYTRPLGGEEQGDPELSGDGKLLGQNEDGLPVSLRKGRFGVYVQLGEATEENKKPKRSSLPRGATPDQVDLEMALGLLALPREIGAHPADGEKVEAGIGRFGPFVKHGKTYASIPKDEDVLTIGMNRAVTLIAEKLEKRKGPKALKSLGDHPDGGEVEVKDGRYGPYVAWKKINATLPKGVEPDDVTLDQALELIAAKQAKGGKGTKKKAVPKKAAVRKPAAKKPAARKKAPAKNMAE